MGAPTSLLAAAIIFAAAGSAIIDDDGVVVGTLRVASGVDTVRAKVGDPLWVLSIGGDGTTATLRETKGDCSVLDYVSEHAVATARYRVQQCPTATGFRADLVESPSFSSYWTTWTLTADGTGTQIEYRIKLVSSLTVPQWIVRRATRSSVQKLIDRLSEEL